MKPRFSIELSIALCVSVLPAVLQAQSIAYMSRNGANTVYCGRVGEGPSELHRFDVAESTQDVLVVSDPAAENWPASSATSQLEVLISSASITITEGGNAQRGALRPFIDFGVYSVAAASDSWEFELAAPARFTFHARWNSSSAAPEGVGGGYAFGGFGIRPDPGTSTNAMSGAFSESGAFERHAQGRLLAGRYSVGMNFRVDGVNTYPFTGFFEGTMTVEIGPDAPAITKTTVSQQGLEMEWSDLGTKQYTVETSSSLFGDGWLPVAGVTWPLSTNVISLPPPTSFPAFYRVRME